MVERPRDHLMDHEYDGIQEFDNPCPGWWNWLFFGTVVFSVWYFIFFQFSPAAWTNASWYDNTVAESLRQQFAEIGELSPDEATLVQYMNDAEWLTVGAGVYKTQCAKCHGPDASGDVGPNLTDDLYKNVQTVEDIATVVADGANNNAMPSLKALLHPNEIVLVSAYVASLRGQNLPGVGVEGEVAIDPWPELPADAQPSETPTE